MRLIKTGKSIMNLTEEEANKLMEMTHNYTDMDKIPKVKAIELFDDYEGSMLVMYQSEFYTEQSYIFREEDIYPIKGSADIASKIKIEFLINHGYLKIDE
ncbi:hypothetical protein [Sebaldella sp. S0638]|uniref:hypothetical protein n=1 Tax=Sebaldella sp. S0638 TaxID=2957809 RepID=UPI00209F0A3E|nr:hypothetical protein [Sebaldella sp. S0638]MCP1226156.1 hypothetical protein [Sebaldella sp. S0638]